LVTELCDISLQELLSGRKPIPLSLQPRLSLAMQIAEGVQYLHDNGIVHRDLKPANILLILDASSGCLTAKIGDFGLSRRTADDASMTALIGTVQYMAPEMLNTATDERVEYSAAVDVFSFGIILWQLVTSTEPYSELVANRFQLLQRIARDGLRPEVPVWTPPPLASLMRDCWVEAEHLRPTSTDVVRRLRVLYHSEFGLDWRQSDSASISGSGPLTPLPQLSGGQSGQQIAWRQSFPR